MTCEVPPLAAEVITLKYEHMAKNPFPREGAMPFGGPKATHQLVSWPSLGWAAPSRG